MNNQPYVRSETRKGVTTIEFHHPRGNSLPASLLEQLTQRIHSAGNDEDSAVIVLRSYGNSAFCAGASFDELVAIQNQQEGLEFFSGFAHLINAMRKIPKLIIARVHNKCIGGGVGIAAAADYAIATDNVEIRLSELALGIGPFVVGPVVERKIGAAAFAHLAIDANMGRNAEWCKRKGLFAETHPSAEDMDESIARLAQSLSHANPEAVAEMKKILWKGTENWDQLLIERAAISGRLILSRHSREAIEKFKLSRTQAK